MISGESIGSLNMIGAALRQSDDLLTIIGGIRKAGFLLELGELSAFSSDRMGEWVEFVVRLESEDVDVLSERYDSPDKDSSSGTGEAVAERWRPFLTVGSIDGGELQSLLVSLERSTRAGEVLALLVLERPPLWPPMAGRN